MDLEILRIASENNNNKYIQNHTHHSKLKNPLCGDEMQINLIIDEERIIDFGYQGKCCVYCQASASLLSKISINKKKSKINELCDDAKSFFDGNSDIIKKKWKLMRKLFKPKNKARKECILLPFKTVQKIVSD
jgi:nitrogen fixation NifU-like protein